MPGYLRVTGAFESDATLSGSDPAAVIELNVVVLDDAAGPVADPKEAFRARLREIAGLRFAAYEFKQGRLELIGADAGGGNGWLAPLPQLPADRSKPLIEWLERRFGEDKRDEDWASEADLPRELAAADHLDASQMLSASMAWTAPVPQNAGLTRILGLPGGDKTKPVVIVPFAPDDVADGDPPPPSLAATPLANAHNDPIGYKIALSGGQVTPRLVYQLETFTDATLLVDPASGFFRVPPDYKTVSVLLRRLREQAATLYSPAPHLLQAQPDELEGLLRFRMMWWRGLAALVTMLDPLLLALTMAGPQREGPFVSALLTCLRALDGLEADVEQERALADLVVAEIQSLIIRPNQLGDAPARQRFLELLELVFEVKPLAAADLPMGPPPEGDLVVDSALAIILAIFRDAPEPAQPFDDARYLDAFETRLDQELAEVLRRIESEEAIEAAAVRLFDRANIAQRVDSVWPKPVPPPNQTPRSQDLIAGLRLHFAEGFNGLDAARHAVGELFQREVQAAASALASPDLPGWPAYWAVLEKGEWLAKRLRLKAQDGPFKNLFDHLPALPGLDLPTLPQSEIVRFTNIEEIILASLRRGLDQDDSRFVPDEAVLPIPIPIAVDQDSGDGDDFSRQYDGVGVLIRRGTEPWAHANLVAALAPGEPPALTLLPLDPVDVDGRRETQVGYTGFPFGLHAAPADPNPAEPHTSYYSLDEPFDVSATQPKLPGLAYGMNYEAAAFAISRSGALPTSVAALSAPWVPSDTPEPAGKGTIQEIPYRRTTRIGALAWTASAADSALETSLISQIKPLAGDYPRVGASTTGRRGAAVELWRDALGAGAIAAPARAGERRSVTLDDIDFEGAGGRLSLQIVPSANAAPDDPAATFAVVIAQPFQRGQLTIELSRTAKRLTAKLSVSEGSWRIEGSDTIDLGAKAQHLWVRARFEGEDSGSEWSVADPGASGAQRGAAARLDPRNFMLLAPPRPSWRKDIPGKRTLELKLPRMSFADLDRWLENPALLEREGAAPGNSLVATLRTRLLDAHLDAKLAEQVKNWLHAIPDLAVGAIRLRLQALDGLPMGADPLDQRRASVRSELGVDDLRIPPLEKTLAEIQSESKYPIATANLGSILRELDKKYTQTIEIVCADAKPFGLHRDAKGIIGVALPAGLVARLTAERLVAQDLLDEASPLRAIEPRMRQLATDRHDGFFVFAGPSMTIETMTEMPTWAPLIADWPGLASDRFGLGLVDHARRYTLVLNEKPTQRDPYWRFVGSADVTEQRWRFLGRPIYARYNPKPDGHSAGQPVIRQTKISPELLAFENEAFFDRTAGDAETHEAAALAPVGTPTVIRTVEWDNPSATLFRHQIALYGRYAGARHDPASERVSVHGKGGAYPLDEWIRVAVLAQAPTKAMTRPQVRGLIPLTAAVDNDRAAPILALLEEPPLGLGGLAERITAEIRTGFGYKFHEKVDGDKKSLVLGIEDSRKEFGPDPLLTYDATPHDIAQSMTLAAEGPIGLTFDTNTSAPALPNGAVLLSPIALADDAPALFEEHFAGTSLRRYFDPNWVDAGEVDVALDQPAWFHAFGSAQLMLDGRPILNAVADADGWKVEAYPERILPESSTTQAVQVASLGKGKATSLSILHLPLEPGRFALSVYAVPPPSAAIGPSRSQLPIASFEWTAGAAPNPTFEFKDASNRSNGKALPAFASLLTPLEWVRTGRDHRYLHARRKSDGHVQRTHVEEVHAVSLAGGTRLGWQDLTGAEIAPRPSLLATPDPLFVHRHLAMIVTEQIGGRAHPLEAFRHAQLLVGSEQHTAPLSTRHRIRLMEFEMPARTLGLNSLCGEFKSATFDLQAIVPAAPEVLERGMVRSLTFWLRPLGNARRIEPEWSLGFDLAWKSRAASSSGGSIALDLKAASSIRADLLVLRVPVGMPADAKAWAVTDEGERVPLDFGPRPGNVGHISPLDGLESLTWENAEVAQGGNALTQEWWCDVSMLTTLSPIATEDQGLSEAWSPSVDWSWFFTGSNEPTPSPALTPRSLRDMVEAQARIITVSPPIPVVMES